MRLHPVLLGLIFMALAAAFFAYSLTFPALPGQRVGPGLFPQVVAVGIFLCGLVMAFEGRHSRQPWFTIAPELKVGRQFASFALMLGAVLFYIVLAPVLGFLPVAAVVVGSLAYWFGARAWVAALAAVLAALTLHWFFATIMRVPLPRGLFMQLLFGG